MATTQKVKKDHHNAKAIETALRRLGTSEADIKRALNALKK